MKKFKVIFLLFNFAIVFMFPHRVEAQLKISSSVIGNGGAVLSDTSFRLIGTIGQQLIGITNNSTFINKLGFWYINIHLITGVKQFSNSVPKEFLLEQNYPNPFNPTTTIQFALPKRSSVTLKLFDVRGREMATLVDKELLPGEYQVKFDASDLASGVYFYRIQSEGFVQTKKLMLLK